MFYLHNERNKTTNKPKLPIKHFSCSEIFRCVTWVRFLLKKLQLLSFFLVSCFKSICLCPLRNPQLVLILPILLDPRLVLEKNSWWSAWTVTLFICILFYSGLVVQTWWNTELNGQLWKSSLRVSIEHLSALAFPSKLVVVLIFKRD